METIDSNIQIFFAAIWIARKRAVNAPSPYDEVRPKPGNPIQFSGGSPYAIQAIASQTNLLALNATIQKPLERVKWAKDLPLWQVRSKNFPRLPVVTEEIQTNIKALKDSLSTLSFQAFRHTPLDG